MGNNFQVEHKKRLPLGSDTTANFSCAFTMGHWSASQARKLALFLVVAALVSIALPASGTVNTLGTARLFGTTCPDEGIANATCYEVVISDCPDTTGDFVAVIKVNDPPDPFFSNGTVFFTVSGTGIGFYDNAFPKTDPRCSEGENCSLMAVQNINSAGYRTVQVNFNDPDDPGLEPSGWLTGPAVYGHRSLACRYATLVHQVWVDLLDGDTQRPVCATGNSAGGSAIGYAITQYGMGNPGGPGPLFTMVEPTSGPPMGRIDHGCMGPAAPRPVVSCPAGTSISENYGLALAAAYLDPAFYSDVCTIDIESDGEDADPTFFHDSVLSDDFPQPQYQTFVKILFGSADLTQAVPLGLEWYDAITSPKAEECIAGAGHELPANFDGAAAIVEDVTTFCRPRLGDIHSKR